MHKARGISLNMNSVAPASASATHESAGRHWAHRKKGRFISISNWWPKWERECEVRGDGFQKLYLYGFSCIWTSVSSVSADYNPVIATIVQTIEKPTSTTSTLLRTSLLKIRLRFRTSSLLLVPAAIVADKEQYSDIRKLSARLNG
jgi:hypothetical protein